MAEPSLEARFAFITCDDGYSTNMPLGVAMDNDVIFIYEHEGKPITPEHGFPVRLMVPKRYAYKAAKWVNGIEFLKKDKKGFWEARGYNNSADPWKEERYE
jgi:DMSO/TMAO reductase YedYZ molybdopterin-dependent catalytic subunit